MRKYFLELFAIGLVDSEGRINTEHMTSDALMTAMKTMEELTKMKMDRLVLETTMEMILCMFESFVILMARHLKNQMIKRKINRNLRVPYQRKCRNL